MAGGVGTAVNRTGGPAEDYVGPVGFVARRVEASETYGLRHTVLGRGRTPAEVASAHDVHPDSAHFAVTEHGLVVATGMVSRRSPPGEASPGWQVRGMAVEPQLRNRGLGSAVLRAIIDHVRSEGGGLVWCHARVAAVTLYERHGFAASGEPFDDPVAGRQVFMSTAVR